MTESLSEKRCRFTRELALLIQYANGIPGYAVAVDQVKRTQAEADANAKSGAGIRNSLHLLGLAADLLIYTQGRYRPDMEPYRVLGSYWRARSPDHAWGGDFSKPDPGHFSISHNGIR